MFVLRGLDGQIVTSTEWEKEEKEEQHETYVQAQRTLEEIEKSLPKGLFRIVATECERCGGDNDLTIIHVNDEPKAYCQKCRVEMFAKGNPVGRPSDGVHSESLTLQEDEWDNYACLGYVIAGAKKIGYDDEEIRKLVRGIYEEFDSKSVAEANEIYRKSDY